MSSLHRSNDVRDGQSTRMISKNSRIEQSGLTDHLGVHYNRSFEQKLQSWTKVLGHFHMYFSKFLKIFTIKS